jgi:hypothetical protein
MNECQPRQPDLTLGPTHRRAPDYGGVSSLVIIYASMLLTSTRYAVSTSSDLGGQCPINAPANCTQGPTWSPNGASTYINNVFCHALTLAYLTEPLFWMHHAVSD